MLTLDEERTRFEKAIGDAVGLDDERRAYQRYAEWLSVQGNPLAAYISARVALVDAQSNPEKFIAIKRERASELNPPDSLLLGALARWRSCFEFEFGAFGFPRKLRILPPPSGKKRDAFLADLCEAPGAPLLRLAADLTLVHFPSSEPLWNAISASGGWAATRRLSLQRDGASALNNLRTALPHLQRLELSNMAAFPDWEQSAECLHGLRRLDFCGPHEGRRRLLHVFQQGANGRPYTLQTLFFFGPWPAGPAFSHDEIRRMHLREDAIWFDEEELTTLLHASNLPHLEQLYLVVDSFAVALDVFGKAPVRQRLRRVSIHEVGRTSLDSIEQRLDRLRGLDRLHLAHGIFFREALPVYERWPNLRLDVSNERGEEWPDPRGRSLHILEDL